VKAGTAILGIVTRNRAALLPKAVSSAIAQSCPKLSVAVLDDGSEDSTPAIAREFPNVLWERWDRNQGLMAARNHLMNGTERAFYVSLDDDAWFIQGDEVAVALDFLEEHASIAAVAFDILSPDRPDSSPRSDPEPAASFIGCGHVLRLSAVRRVGAYGSTPGSYGGEEKDLCLRLMDAGYEIVRLPGVHVWHDKTPEARHLPAQHRSGVCNDLVMALRRTPAFLLPLALPFKFVRHFSFSWKRQLTRPCLEGFRLFLGSVPSVWRSRKPVRFQTLRKFMRLSAGGQS
jgi:GT2 family glycosyltransferase